MSVDQQQVLSLVERYRAACLASLEIQVLREGLARQLTEIDKRAEAAWNATHKAQTDLLHAVRASIEPISVDSSIVEP